MLGSSNSFTARSMHRLSQDVDQGSQDQALKSSNKENSNSVQCGGPIGTGKSTVQAHAVALDADVKKAMSCNLCNGLLASSLVLQCSHTFCGSCLFDHLNARPSCPTCNVGLRAIPVRCLALDGVVQAFNKLTTRADQEAYSKRVEDGKSSANKLSKMFWWLQPSVPVAGGDGAAPPTSSMAPQSQPQAGASMATAQAAPRAMLNRHRSASYGGAALPPTPQPQGMPTTFNSFSAGMPPAALRYGGLPAHPALSNMPHLAANPLGPMQSLMPSALADSANTAAFLSEYEHAQYQTNLAQAAQLQQLIQQLSYLG